MKAVKRFCLLILTFASVSATKAQNVAVKTNLLADCLLNVNAGIEVGLDTRWTLDLDGQFNFWTVNDHKWKHWLLKPEARYWFCERFAGHFLGFHALGGEYNFARIKNNISFLGSDFSPLTDLRYQGWGIGAGIAYGYDWVLSMHWNLEAEIGIGWIYTRYDVFPCTECGSKLQSNMKHNYFGPTKVALSLVYLF